MTENRCIEVLKKMKHMFTETCAKIDENTALDMAVEAIRENQQYRAIGTVEELKTAMLYVSPAKIHGTVGRAIDACAEYESIGTIEEFKTLKEKNTDIEKIIESIKQLPTQDFMGVLHIPRTATINRIKRGGNCELPEV